MNRRTIKILQNLRKIHAQMNPAAHRSKSLVVEANPEVDLRGQAANDLIRGLLEARQPLMISRIGGTEIPAVVAYVGMSEPKLFLRKAGEFITGQREVFWWSNKTKSDIQDFSGFFPPSEEMLRRYSVETLEDLQQIDVLGSWLRLEKSLRSYFPAGMTRVPVADLQPFHFERPWSEALEGRKVLVIHPFEDSIRTQYARRKLLFKNPRLLPDFELKTFRAVQSLVGNRVEFGDWFAALDWMRGEIEKINFDVAIIGAGAYGLPLAAHVKRMGRQAVHLGGITQILFGIRGKRWDGDATLQGLYNENWLRPLKAETPEGFRKLESGAYW